MCLKPTRAFNSSGEVVSLACDTWSCSDCAKVLAWRWSERVRYGLALSPEREAWFWTLTLPGWVSTAQKGYALLPRRWDNFRKHIQRAVGRWSYVAFIEAHPHRDFIPHFHIISLQKSPARLKDIAHHAGFGYQAREVRINGRSAATYVSKYASKQGQGMARYFRRVRVSHDWPRLPSPVYELQVYPPQKGESLTRYLQRVSTTLVLPLEMVRARWLDRSLDVT